MISIHCPALSKIALLHVCDCINLHSLASESREIDPASFMRILDQRRS